MKVTLEYGLELGYPKALTTEEADLDCGDERRGARGPSDERLRLREDAHAAPMRFHEQARGPCPPLDALMLSVAGEFGPVEHRFARTRLEELGCALLPAAVGDPAEQAGRAFAVLAEQEGLRAAPQLSPETLMLDRVLRCGRGHPLLLSIVYVEAAPRAAMPLLPVGTTETTVVGHRGTDPPVILDPGHDRGTFSPRAHPPLAWQCAHEVAFLVLGALIEAFALHGQLFHAIRAAGLRRALP